jgi:hypothetical protein
MVTVLAEHVMPFGAYLGTNRIIHKPISEGHGVSIPISRKVNPSLAELIRRNGVQKVMDSLKTAAEGGKHSDKAVTVTLADFKRHEDNQVLPAAIHVNFHSRLSNLATASD